MKAFKQHIYCHIYIKYSIYVHRKTNEMRARWPLKATMPKSVLAFIILTERQPTIMENELLSDRLRTNYVWLNCSRWHCSCSPNVFEATTTTARNATSRRDSCAQIVHLFTYHTLAQWIYSNTKKITHCRAHYVPWNLFQTTLQTMRSSRIFFIVLLTAMVVLYILRSWRAANPVALLAQLHFARTRYCIHKYIYSVIAYGMTSERALSFILALTVFFFVYCLLLSSDLKREIIQCHN